MDVIQRALGEPVTVTGAERISSDAIARGKGDALSVFTGTVISRPTSNEIGAIRALSLVAKNWKLSDREAGGLLGVEPAQWRHLKRIAMPDSRDGHADGASGPIESLSWIQVVMTQPQQWLDHVVLVFNHLATEFTDRSGEADAGVATLSEDQLSRIAAVFYIYITLRRLDDQEIADGWVKRKNHADAFGGREPIAVMIDGGLPKIWETRDYLEAKAGS